MEKRYKVHTDVQTEKFMELHREILNDVINTFDEPDPTIEDIQNSEALPQFLKDELIQILKEKTK